MGFSLGRRPKDLTSNSLAVERTRMASERTLLAWVRTAMSFISFGFTLYKVLGAAAEVVQDAGALLRERPVGILLMFMGMVPLAVAIVQFYETSIHLGCTRREILLSAPFVLALFMLMVGILLYFNIIFKWKLL